MCEVAVELPGGGVMTSVMTISSMEEMALKVNILPAWSTDL